MRRREKGASRALLTEREPNKTHLSRRRPTMFHDNLPIIDLLIDADGLLLPPSPVGASKVSKVATPANPTQEKEKEQAKHDSSFGTVARIHATDSKSPRHPGAPATPRGKDFNSKRKDCRSDTSSDDDGGTSNEGAGDPVQKRFKSTSHPQITNSEIRLCQEIGALKKQVTVQLNYIANLEAKMKVFEQRELAQKMQMKTLMDAQQQGHALMSQVYTRIEGEKMLHKAEVKGLKDNEAVLKKTITCLEQKLEQAKRNKKGEVDGKEHNFLEQMRSIEKYQKLVQSMSLETLHLRLEHDRCKQELQQANQLRLLKAPTKETEKNEPAGRAA